MCSCRFGRFRRSRIHSCGIARSPAGAHAFCPENDRRRVQSRLRNWHPQITISFFFSTPFPSRASTGLIARLRPFTFDSRTETTTRVGAIAQPTPTRAFLCSPSMSQHDVFQQRGGPNHRRSPATYLTIQLPSSLHTGPAPKSRFPRRFVRHRADEAAELGLFSKQVSRQVVGLEQSSVCEMKVSWTGAMRFASTFPLWW